MVFFLLLPRNQATIHAPQEPQFTKAKESTAEQIQISSNDDHFFDIQRIVHMNWVPER
jgi:hypothetical protein